MSSKQSSGKPKATRPNIPDYGIVEKKTGMLPWKWASERLSKSKQFWIATVRPDGAPHVMVVWGVWVDGAFWFSTGEKSRKARNLAQNPRCVICSEDAEEAVIVEGRVEIIKNAATLKKLYSVYKKKYKIDISGMDSPIYRVQPAVAFGMWEKKFTQTATRWLFSA